MIKLERKIIYIYTKDIEDMYQLILGTSSWGCILVKIKDIPKVYSGIDGIKIDNIGYVCIDNIRHIPWNSINLKKNREYRKLSDKEYNQIVNAISQYMLGIIEFNCEGTLMYQDELESFNKIKIAIESKHTKDNTLECNNDIKRIEADNIEQNVVDNSIETSSEEMETADNSIETSSEEMETADNSIPESGVKCYDLLAMESTKPIYVKNADSIKSSSTRVGNKLYRHIYTDDETLTIAVMNSECVSAKYSVSLGIARIMIRNAKRIFDFEVKSAVKNNNFYVLFKAGHNVKSVVKITGVDECIVQNSYKNFMINNNPNKDNKAALDKWNYIISSNDYSTMASAIYDKTIRQFGIDENCSVATAKNISCRIRNVLFINPLHAAGFEMMAVNSDKLLEFMHTCANKNNANCKAIIWIYDKVLKLYNVYMDTYNDHADILAGSKPIPDTIEDEDRDEFLTLIYNRFNYNKLKNKDRFLNKYQKSVVKSNASTAEFAKAFMILPNRATVLKYGYKTSK